jgi:sugar (pentulose or hexulose) kinase
VSQQYVIGIDNGTSVVKVAVFDMRGNEIAVAARNTPVLEKMPGWSEYDMDVDWRETALAIKDALAKAAVTADEIAAVGVSGKGVGVCFLDRDLRPLRPGVLWNDARALPLMEEWIANGVMDRIFDISGNWLMPGDEGLVIAWMAQHEPDMLAKTHTICLPTGWLAYKLTGNLQFNRADAYSQLDIIKGEYSDEVMALEGISQYRHIFPEFGNPWDVVGGVTPAAAEETGLNAGTPVVRLGFDVVACAAGVGAIHEGQANIILGTAGVMELVLSQPLFTPRQLGLQYIHSVPDTWLKLIAPMTVTPHVDWFVRELAGADQARAQAEGRSIFSIFDEEVARIAPGSGGVIFHPYMANNGERAPFTKTTAKANFFGLGLHSSRYHLLRAIYEGIAFSNKHCVDVSPVPVTDIRLSGGGAKSPVWAQIFADVLNATIRIPAGSELGAKGAAWNAAFGAGLFKTREEAVEAFCQVERVYEPNPAAVAPYAEVYEIYKGLVPHLYDAWDARARFLAQYEPSNAH